MTLNWFANVLVHHPFMVLICVAVFSGSCLIIPLSLKIYPNFEDPQMGFETRGTNLARRQIAWKNLIEATRSSGPFILNPKEWLYRENITRIKKLNKKKKSRQKNDNFKKSEPEILIIHRNNTKNERNTWGELERLINNESKILPEMDIDTVEKVFNEGFFCGPPDEKYIQIVIEAKEGRDLFNLESLKTLCDIEHKFMENKYYRKLCILTKSSRRCCRPWSLGNYVALLTKKSSCSTINENDVNYTKELLRKCSHSYHNFTLTADCTLRGYCSAPMSCRQYDAVFNILNFLTSSSFLPANETSHIVLKETIIFFPLACSTATLPYYHEIEKWDLDYDNMSVVAIEMGLKNALFDEYLIRDTWLMIASGVFLIMCMWLYTKSIFLTIMTIIVIIFSLSISYFLYTLVFELRFFPFMNLLATVVAIGIGADDTFIFCKIWLLNKSECNDNNGLVKIMSDTIYHAYSSMFVTSATTAAAFLASYISSITAVRCFSIFASIAVMSNCILMMSWFPACVVLWERYHRVKFSFFHGRIRMLTKHICCFHYWNFLFTGLRMKVNYFCTLWEQKQQAFIDAIINLRYLWFILFSLLACASAVVVFHKPKLQLPNTPEFQLFHSKHLFEQYDLKYKDMFWFKRAQKNYESNAYYNLPLRFVWGILPVDNGNYLDPQSLGNIELDPVFDISDPESQKWLLEFCQNIRNQSFYQSTYGLPLSNCFIETFVNWMSERLCINPIDKVDRSPCCKSEIFPYKKSVFNLCIPEAIANLYETPTKYLTSNVAGPKFSKSNLSKISAIIIEYDSNFTYSMSYDYMHNFFNQVENWMKKQLETAPAQMKNGWFISEFSLYDLQQVLSESTVLAIFISMALALIVLLLSTLNLFISIYAIITITLSILVTVAVLILLGWQLNILESIALSTAIGLTVDFSLHYAVHYRLSSSNLLENRQIATRYALKKMLGPSSMAAITTGAVGAFMMPSLILPYIQIGVFLVIVMSVSWIYATFHLSSTLAIFGPEKQYGQFYYSNILVCCKNKKRQNTQTDVNKKIEQCNASQRSDINELELESLTNKTTDNIEVISSIQSEKSCNFGHKTTNRNRSDQSPSATSAVTIIMADEN